MASTKRVFRTRVQAQDPLVRDHRIHGVRVLPGVTFLDLILRMARHCGLDPARITLRRILFDKPIALDETDDLPVRLLFEERSGLWTVSVLTPRKIADRLDTGEWIQHARAELVNDGSASPVKAGCDPKSIDWTQARDLDDAYASVRAAGIHHSDFMKSGGRFAVDADVVWAELTVADSALAYVDQFWLHPAVLDAATVVAAFPLARAKFVADPPACIPFFIEEFRARLTLPPHCLVRAETPRPSGNDGDLYSQDIDLFDPEGNWLAGFARLTGKRIRSAEAIQKLIKVPPAPALSASKAPILGAGDKKAPPMVAEPVPTSAATAAKPSGPLLPGRERLVGFLYSLIANHRHGQLDGVGEDVRFYDQGLESMDLLQIVELLETKLGRQLYPTLLFEHPSIGQLADYLLEAMPDSVASLLELGVDTIPDPATSSDPGQLGASRSPHQEKLKTAPVSTLTGDGPVTEPVQDVDGVAVIGMSGRFPMSQDLAALWSNLRAGRDCIREVPLDRWDASAYYDPEKGRPGKTCSKWGGWLDHHDCFDHRFFRISPHDAEEMDPQERLFLETVWALLEDAGYTPDGLGRAAGGVERREVGVFVGSMWTEYQLFHDLAASPAPVFCHSSLSSIANRVSYCLDFRGPSLGVDTMCSSSLLAIHLACRSLLSGECRVAVAGGVNLSLHPAKYLHLGEREALSTDGRCRSFAEGGNGYVPAEGVGAVLLKPLRQAVADLDPIYGVIRGSAANHGGATSGFTVPSPKAQTEVIERALEMARVHPRTVSYIEAHGTGTALGDPIEIQGLTQAFRRWTLDRQFCSLGSVKSNIGHLEAAAGVASLIKVLLQMRFGQLIPSLHSETSNPKIPWSETPFRLQRELADWNRPTLDLGQGGRVWPRRAGISSFGAGGTNVHLVVEEHLETSLDPAPPALTIDPELILLSAKGSDQLLERARQLHQHLTDADDEAHRAALGDIAHTLRVGRVELEHRLALVAEGPVDLANKLAKFVELKSSFPGVFVGRVAPQRLGAPMPQLEPVSPSAAEARSSAESLETIARAWSQGHSFDWSAVFPQPFRRRVRLPTYPFSRDRHWAPCSSLSEVATQARAGNEKPMLVGLEASPEVLPAPLNASLGGNGHGPAPVPALDDRALHERVQAAVIAIVSEVLKVKVSDINPDSEVAEFGFDSITITRLADRLGELYGITVNSSRFFDQPTINGFARYLSQEFGPALRQHFGTALPENGRNDSVPPAPAPAEVKGNRASAVAPRATKPPMADEPIAIVGMSGRFPQSHDLREFWQNLVASRDLVTEVPVDRWDWKAHFGDPATQGNRTLCKWGGFMPGVDRFDALFFGISPREAELMDPQQRLFLEASWLAIESAGYRPSRLSGTRTGVFVGVGTRDYFDLLARDGGRIEAHQATGAAHSIVANRVSYLLNLRGPSEAIDTACSSSLVAIHRALLALRHGDCDAALAGGVNVLLSPDVFVAFSKAGMLSPDGRCRTFDSGANGYVRGEGVGVVMLKLLSQAEADGDPIHALILASSVNHGGKAASLTAPNPNAQAEVLISAYERAGIDPDTVGYIETHGTGTRLGDPVEINALKRAFQHLRCGRLAPTEPFCALGSVKTNAGHLETAAGIAGLLKVALSLEHRTLPGNLHFKQLNPLIELEGSPFYVLSGTRPWLALEDLEHQPVPRRAGVSSFGFGGANAHVVLQEYQASKSVVTDAPSGGCPELILLSAPTPAQLDRTVRDLSAFMEDALQAQSTPSVGSIAYTLQVGREARELRLAFLARDLKELAQRLADILGGRELADVWRPPARLSSASQIRFDDDDGRAFIAALWQKGRLEKLAQLWVAGTAIDFESLPRTQTCRRVSLPTHPFAGERYWAPKLHQVPPIPAAPGSGSIVPPPLHPLIDHDCSTVESLCCRKRLDATEFYLRDHSVLQRPVLPAAAYLEMARAAGEHFLKSPVTALEDVVWVRPVVLAQPFLDLFIQLTPKGPGAEFQVCSQESNGRVVFCRGRLVVSTTPVHAAASLSRLDLPSLGARLTHSIKPDDLYAAFAKGGVQYGPTFRTIRELRFSNGETLAHLELALESLDGRAAFVLHPALIDGCLQAVLGVIDGQLAPPAEGPLFLPFAVDRVEVMGAVAPHAYVFAKRTGRLGNDPAALATTGVSMDVVLADNQGNVLVRMTGVNFRQVKQNPPKASTPPALATSGLCFFEPTWRRSPAIPSESCPQIPPQPSILLLFDDIDERAASWRQAATQFGPDQLDVVQVRRGEAFNVKSRNLVEIRSDSPADYQRLFESFLKDRTVPALVVCISAAALPIGDGHPKHRLPAVGASCRQLLPFFCLAQALARSPLAGPVRFFNIHRASAPGSQPLNTCLNGAGQTLTKEVPGILYRGIELAGPAISYDQEYELVIREFAAPGQKIEEVRYTTAGRLTREVARLNTIDFGAPAAPGLRTQGVYLLTGGAGGLGLVLAGFLARKFSARLVLSGRSRLTDAQAQALEALRGVGASVLYVRADITRPAMTRRLATLAVRRFGALHGVIHCAGVLRDGFLAGKERTAILEVLEPKIEGALNLDEATRNIPLDFFVLFASIAGVFGNPGQSDYAAGNRFLDAFAEYRDELRRQGSRLGRTLSINWPWWQEGGMPMPAAVRDALLQTAGLEPLDSMSGVAAFQSALACPVAQCIVAKGAIDKIERTFSASVRVETTPAPYSDPISAPPRPADMTSLCADPADLRERSERFLILRLAPIFKLSPDRIRPDEGLDKYGIDSFLVLSATQELESLFGPLPKTLFFEHLTVRDLAAFFRNRHAPRLRELLHLGEDRAGLSSPLGNKLETAHDGKPGVPLAPPPLSPPSILPAILGEAELAANSELQARANALLIEHGHEGAWAFNRKILAPSVFLSGSRTALFLVNAGVDSIFVWAFAGPESAYPGLVEELQNSIGARTVDFLTGEVEANILARMGYSTTPIGVLQGTDNLASFSLQGKAMQRLRYQLNHYSKGADCLTHECRPGSDPIKDQALIELVDQWITLKAKRVPLVEHFKQQIQQRTLDPRYRVFLTSRNGRFDNAVVVTRVESRGGYLMDLEFYRSDMPLGGLEFTVTAIIDVLLKEGCRCFSLGATLGVGLNSHPYADPAVAQTLREIHDAGMLNGDANFQFKNKFRFSVSPLFICRPKNADPGTFLNLLMHLAHPEVQAEPQALPLPVASRPSLPIGQSASPARAPYESARVAALRAAEFNVLRLASTAVEFDLKTDSWAELEGPELRARVERLRAAPSQSGSVETDLQALFPFTHILLGTQGRALEAILCQRLGRPASRVFQNRLFPTLIYHQITNGLVPEEVPQIDLGATDSGGGGFTGGLDLDKLEALLSDPGSGQTTQLVCVEVSNNAAGGYPVALENLKRARELAHQYGARLWVDATRLLGNALKVQAQRPEDPRRSLVDICRGLASQADYITASLTKEFGVPSGALIALNDDDLAQDLAERIELQGAGLRSQARHLLKAALSDLPAIESQVRARMSHAANLANQLHHAGVPVLYPAGVHCVLLNTLKFKPAETLNQPAPSFLAWLYTRTGIRGGIHNTGLKSGGQYRGWVRFALPVGLSDDACAEIARRLSSCLTSGEPVPPLAMTARGAGSFGEVLAGFAPSRPEDYPAPKERTMGESAPSAIESIEAPLVPGVATTVAKNMDSPNPSELGRGSFPVAVIGMSGRYPLAADLRQFWKNLREGEDCIREVPAERWDYRRYVNAKGKPHSRFGGFISDIDKFDALLFNISPAEAEVMDPQERLFLETAWATLEDAGYPRHRLQAEPESRRMGVFVGVVWSLYQIYGAEEVLKGNLVAPNSFHWSIPNRVSYFFDLEGPSLAIDTACSASLTALHLACEAIRRGECGLALAGGVNLELHPNKGLNIDASKMVSSEGKCRSFGEGGDGYVAGEGVGAVLLKPLRRALEDGDRIDGVILGTALNHGGKTNGYTVPNPKAQSRVVLAALSDARVDARSITYVEAHGTGTPLGDPIEVAGLTHAFQTQTGDRGFCALGSVKSNIGHLEAAAGIAGLTKILLQFRFGTLVPSLHAEKLNSHIDFAHTPFHVQTSLEPWGGSAGERPSGPVDLPLRAGLSSFGAGGANAHVVLEGPPALCKTLALTSDTSSSKPEAIVISARTEDRLRANATQLRDHLRYRLSSEYEAARTEPTDEPSWFRALAFTLQRGREAMDFRLGFIASSIREALQTLESFLVGEGQGTSWVSGRALANSATTVAEARAMELELRRLVQAGRLDELVRNWVAGSVVDWLSFHPGSRPIVLPLPTYPFARRRIWIAQTPAPLVNTFVQGAESRDQTHTVTTRLEPSAFYLRDHVVSGRSMLPAAAMLEMPLAAGRACIPSASGFDLRDVVLLAPIQPGLESIEALTVLRPVAGKPGTWQFEISIGGSGATPHARGKLVAAAAASEFPPTPDLDAVRGRCTSKIKGPDIYAAFQRRGLDYGPAFQVIAELRSGPEESLARLELPPGIEPNGGFVLHPSWVDGALQTVVGLMKEENGTASEDPYVPFSIGQVLVRQPLHGPLLAYATRAQPDASSSLKRFNVTLFTPEGQPVAYFGQFAIRLLKKSTPLPLGNNVGQVLTFCRPAWRPLPAGAARIPTAAGGLLLFHSDPAVWASWLGWNRGAGTTRRIVGVQPGPGPQTLGADLYQVRPDSEEDYQHLIATLRHAGVEPASIVFADFCGTAALNGESRLAEVALDAVHRSLIASNLLCRALLQSGLHHPCRVLFLTAANQEIGELLEPTLAAFARSLQAETRKLHYRVLSVDPLPAPAALHWNHWWSCVSQEINAPDEDRPVSVVYRGGARLARTLEIVSPEPLARSEDDPDFFLRGLAGKNYLITGGLGGLGRLFARLFLQHGAAHVCLVGRSDSKSAPILSELDQSGARLLYISADVTQQPSIEAALAKFRQMAGPLHGIVHGAGVLRDALFLKKTPDALAEVWSPKAEGLVHLDALTASEPLDFFCAWSSIAALLGNLGQTDYSAANGFMDGFARRRERLRRAGQRTGRTLSINWPLWQEGGMRISSPQEALMEKMTGMEPLPTAQGFEAFNHAWNLGEPQIGVLYGRKESITARLGLAIQTADSRPLPAARTPAPTQRAPAPLAPTPQEIAPPSAVRSAVLKAVVAMFMEFLKLEEQDIDTQTDFAEFGIDSIMMMKMLERVEEQYGQAVDPNVMMEHATIDQLVDHLIQSGIATGGARSNPSGTQLPPVPADTDANRSEVGIHGPSFAPCATPGLGQPSPSPEFHEIVAVAPASPAPAGASGRRDQQMKFAVVALACRFPESPNLERYWDNLRAARNLITEVPPSRWCVADYYDADKRAPNKTYSKWGGFIEGVDLFDAAFFGVSPDDALTMDPQQRIMLELTQELLERAGYTVRELARKRVGIFLGAGMNSYCVAGCENLNARQMQRIIVNRCPNMIAARLADYFNLTGPAMTTDTACSSSLVAVHQGCQSILHGEAEAAIVGGIELLLDPFYHVGFSKAMVLSDEPASYVFDERAKGFVLGEGAGLAMIKPLPKAIADGDQILGVILGSAINNDGRTMGLTVPSQEGQEAVIEAALLQAGVDPASVGYLEAHGTGTLLGDPIEIKAATRVYQRYTQERGYCAVGSVKSNLGHLCRAAGAASLLKVVLALGYRFLPATLHCHRPHPRFHFEQSPFYPLTESKPWPARDGVRRAAISSFGFGGTNCHMILEQHDPAKPSLPSHRQPLPLTQFNRQRYWQTGATSKAVPEHRVDNTARYRELLKDVRAGNLQPHEAARKLQTQTSAK